MTAVTDLKADVKDKTNSKQRLYYAKVAIVGPSGTGKSYLTKTADKTTTGFINVERKPLPYKDVPFTHEGRPKSWSGFMKNLKDYATNPDIHRIIIDSQTMAFNILNAEMKENFTGWDVAKNYNSQVWDYLEYMKNIEKDMIIFSHDERIKTQEGEKERRMFVHNKEYEGKLEEHYTIILYTGKRLSENKPQYFLKTFEAECSTKVPEGLLAGKLEIPNDASLIFKAVEDYYS